MFFFKLNLYLYKWSHWDLMSHLQQRPFVEKSPLFSELCDWKMYSRAGCWDQLYQKRKEPSQCCMSLHQLHRYSGPGQQKISLWLINEHKKINTASYKRVLEEHILQCLILHFKWNDLNQLCPWSICSPRLMIIFFFLNNLMDKQINKTFNKSERCM